MRILLPEFRLYLEGLRAQLRLPPAAEQHVLGEVYTHLEESTRALMERGLPRQDAAREALQQFGKPQVIGRQLYEAYHQGTWQEALYAASPHLAMAVLFGLLHAPAFLLLGGFIALAGAVSLWGWWKGKPVWVYPWVGYALVAPLVAGILAVSILIEGGVTWFDGRPLPLAEWSYLGLLAVAGLIIGLVVNVVRRVLRRDWALVSLMIMPLPVLSWWLLALQPSGKGLVYFTPQFPDQGLGIVTAYLLLAGASAGYVRFRQRPAKILTLVIGMAILSLLLLGAYAGVTMLIAALLSFFSVLFLLSPALLEHGAGRGRDDSERWARLLTERPGGER